MDAVQARHCSGADEVLADARARGSEADSDEVGADCGEGPPVPIPNTAVKLTRAENTWLATARKDR